MTNQYEGIMQIADPRERPVMSRPPRMVASAKFIREVRDVVGIDDDDKVRAIADWIIGHMEGMGAANAQPVFDMKGNGPVCSWCGTLWPLCGHHHTSQILDEDDE